MKQTVHYVKFERPACGVGAWAKPVQGKLALETDRRKITCERCKVTYAYRRGGR